MRFGSDMRVCGSLFFGAFLVSCASGGAGGGTAEPRVSGGDEAAAPAGAVTVASLRCEHRENPLSLDAPAPRLGWILASAQKDQKQTAYQVLVASGEGKLNGDKGDLWDSKK